MEYVLGNIFDLLVHELLHRLHLPFVVSILNHEALLLKNFLIEEVAVFRIPLEALRDSFKAIADAYDDQVFLAHFDVWIMVHGVVVLEHALHRSLQLCLILVVHRDTNS